MDIKQFKKELKSKERSTDSFLRKRAPRIIGRLGENHYRTNFRKGGFVDRTLEPWKTTKRQQSGSLSADSKYGPLLSSRNHLMKATVHETSDYRARIFNDTKYAAIHNYGGEVHPTVTPKMRRYAWYRFFQSGNRAKSPRKQKRVRTMFKKFDFAGASINQNGLEWKRLALTKKTKLDIKIPQRRFIGPSKALNDKIRGRIAKELTKIMNE